VKVSEVCNDLVDYAGGSGPWTDGMVRWNGRLVDPQFDIRWELNRP
jgi:hypothetical protein